MFEVIVINPVRIKFIRAFQKVRCSLYGLNERFLHNYFPRHLFVSCFQTRIRHIPMKHYNSLLILRRNNVLKKLINQRHS